MRGLDHMSLYLMQNEVGLIKIGRSVDPEQRRATLSKVEKCEIALLHVWIGQGAREEAVHLALSDYRVGGEWFDGHDEARAAILDHLGLRGLVWPFALDPVAVNGWLDEFFDRQFDKSIMRDVGRMHEIVRRATAPCWTIDLAAWDMHCLMERGQRFGGSVENSRGGKTVTYAWVDDRKVRVPAYTASKKAALSLWSEDIRPTSWSGTVLDCCKAALEMRREEWKGRRAMLRQLTKYQVEGPELFG